MSDKPISKPYCKAILDQLNWIETRILRDLVVHRRLTVALADHINSGGAPSRKISDMLAVCHGKELEETLAAEADGDLPVFGGSEGGEIDPKLLSRVQLVTLAKQRNLGPTDGLSTKQLWELLGITEKKQKPGTAAQAAPAPKLPPGKKLPGKPLMKAKPAGPTAGLKRAH